MVRGHFSSRRGFGEFRHYFFYIRDKFQIYPAKTKREIDFKVDTVLHGLLWAKTGVRSNVIRSGTLKPFDKSL